MPKHVLFVCKSCSFSSESEQTEEQADGNKLLNLLLDLYQDWTRKSELEIKAEGCLCTCDRPCVVGLSGIDKPTYLFVDLPTLESAAALLKLGELYIDSDDGYIARFKLPEVLQSRRLTRIPPINRG